MTRPDYQPMHPQMAAGARPPRRAALWIAIIYAVGGALWILLSDTVIYRIFTHEQVHAWHVQTYKGWFFIAATAVILYFLVRRTFTAVRASAEARREVERRTQLLLERVRDYAVFTLDATGKIASWNHGAEQITGLGEAEAVGHDVGVLYSWADVEAGIPQRDLSVASQKGWIEQEAEQIRPDGSRLWVARHLSALRGEDGRIEGFMCLWRDITDRRRTRAALEQANQALRSIVDSSPLPIITLDDRGDVRGWNPAAEKTFGWTATEVIGRPLPTVPQAERAKFDDIFRAQMSGTRLQGVDVVRMRKDGTPVELSLWTAELSSGDGVRTGTVGIFADLSDRKRAEEAVRTLNESLERRVRERTARLEEANEELQAFSYTVSHDLRVPLKSLQLIAQDLLEKNGDCLNDDARGDGLRIVGAAARMERQIEDLLEYSRVSRGELKTEPVSLVLVVHETVGRLQRDPSFRDAQVVVQEPLGWVMAHRLTLQQVILNVINNAITFVAPGVRPMVTISSIEKPDHVLRLCIQDNGIGIDEEDRERVFHIFERLPAAERYPGLGVGLTVARRAVERMGGKISIERAPSGGTTFCVDLPRAEQGSREREKSSPRA